MFPLLSLKANIGDGVFTYGMELEYAFAFHESLWIQVLQNGADNKIQEDLTHHAREVAPFTIINPIELPYHVYNSWGILPAGAPPARPYEQEPVDILEEELRWHCP